jgi:hypothetical protein
LFKQERAAEEQRNRDNGTPGIEYLFHHVKNMIIIYR